MWFIPHNLGYVLKYYNIFTFYKDSNVFFKQIYCISSVMYMRTK